MRESGDTPRSQESEASGARGRVGSGAPAALGEVFLARHGQTLSNLRRRYAGSSPEPLTPAGRDQAAQLADRVSGLGITAVWTSEIARAAETARIVADELRVPLRLDPRLNEMMMGPWEGRTEDEIAAGHGPAYDTWLSAPDTLVLPGRETLAQLAARVLPAVREAASAGHKVLLISHVAPIRVSALVVLGIPLSWYKRVIIQNGDCLRLDLGCSLAERVNGARPMSLRHEVEAGPAA